MSGTPAVGTMQYVKDKFTHFLISSEEIQWLNKD